MKKDKFRKFIKALEKGTEEAGEMIETGIIKQLADELSARINPAVPVNVAFWSKKELCACLSVSEAMLNKIILSPDFPVSYRFPSSTAGGKKGYPRWAAKEVLAWAERYRGKEAVL